ncbi:hypothetical protein WH50_07305 [Pokkaliibacter plantistimulans]|uniref:Probable septum site-determining protein MinC n=1 Tax=Pokkaliibacter plantistimulans TaxID=1635171 RepID=A0ABX5M2Y9_9GAMM|nr:septum site-determining protein MinC [Pokkaliibacter plantistimulans]PXF31903.1 hypothetical protein WH50_07305 [Pokkaliibacter plantistimulans]
MSSPATSKASDCFRLKGSMFTLSMIELIHYSAIEFSNQLSRTVNQAPRFFQQMPVVISLEHLADDSTPDFKEIIEICRSLKVNPVGIRGGSDAMVENAFTAGLPSMGSVTPSPSPQRAQTSSPQPAAVEPSLVPARIIDRPVRSGQQIYARNTSLIVLAPVSAGAELLADGDIHVYAPLRGRALAGINGNTQARIFCNALEAELLSIAGQYKLSEDLQHSELWKQSVQAMLEDESKLQLSPLSLS